MVFYHNINPVLLHLGPLEVRWYGVFYALSFLICYFYLRKSSDAGRLKLTKDDVDSFMLWLIVGVVLGARIFEVLFYNPKFYFSNPFEIIAVWHGGLSFHGGLTGAALASWLFCRKKKQSFLQLADNLVIPAAFGLMLGRIANFINGELWGRVTSLPWGVKFPDAEGFRHPSQLYESAKNFIILATIYPLRNRRLPNGFLLAIFMIMYSVFRFFIEFVREPEVMVGPLTMGQLLNIPVFIIGILTLYIVKRNIYKLVD